MPKLSHQQELADFCADYDLPKILLRANEEFEDATCSGTMAVIRVTRWIVSDTNSYRLVEGKATRLEVWRKVENHWILSPNEGMIATDPNFEPVKISRWDRTKSVREWVEDTRWERMCYRPGTSKSPMDRFGINA